jgi:cysteine-rich repeat protein
MLKWTSYVAAEHPEHAEHTKCPPRVFARFDESAYTRASISSALPHFFSLNLRSTKCRSCRFLIEALEDATMIARTTRPFVQFLNSTRLSPSKGNGQGNGKGWLLRSMTMALALSLSLLAQTPADAGPALPTLPLATGGAVTESNGYRIHTFTSSGTFTVAGSGTVEVLVVAGGGSGGNHTTTNANGGGGGGGVIEEASFAVTAGAIAVTVGAGGTAVASATCGVGNNGSDSVFSTLVAIGGGGGGSTCGFEGQAGGSSGGGAYNVSGGAAGAATAGQGNVGGLGNRTWTGGGGGGASSPGVDGNACANCAPSGNGGNGITSSISGSLAYYAGGGGGSGNSSERAGDGYDGGGRGSGTTTHYNYDNYPVEVNATTHGSSTPNAVPNTGGGGGAGSYWAPNIGWLGGSGYGASGIVIVRYTPVECGNDVVEAGETCDDGNTVDGDCCSASCSYEGLGSSCADSNLCNGPETCDGTGICQPGTPPECNDNDLCTQDSCDAVDGCQFLGAPATTCMTGWSKALLLIKESKVGQELVKAKLIGGPALSQTDFGDPAGETTSYDVCIFDDAGNLAASLLVDRAGEDCDGKPCWSDKKGTGWLYKDKLADSDGVNLVKLLGGEAGKTQIFLKAANNAKKSQTSLPLPIANALVGSSSAILQVISSDAQCFEAEISDIKKQELDFFKGKK